MHWYHSALGVLLLAIAAGVIGALIASAILDRRKARRSQPIDSMIQVVQPDETLIVDSADRLVRETETYLRSVGQTRTIPVVPGAIPVEARDLIRSWPHREEHLVPVLRYEYGISEATARLWMHMAKKEYR